jgi:hypothetical protein
VVLAAGVLPAVLAASAADFTPNEAMVSLQRDLIDFEFNATRNQFVWADSQGSLWLGNIDPATGAFTPATGKVTLIDSDAMKTADLNTVFNGPEWVTTATGDKIVYTKYLAGRNHLLRNARLAVAAQDDGETWLPRFLGPNVPRNAPYASEDPADPVPRITYVDANAAHYWRELDNAGTEQVLPMARSVRSVRFVQGRRAVVFSEPVDGVSQVFSYELDSGFLEQLTFDAGNKDIQTVPWIWQAPDYAGAHVLMTVVEVSELRFYRYSDGSFDGVVGWVPIHSVSVPAGSKIASPEPFVHNGQSYVTMAVATASNTFPSSVWLANVNPASPLLRKVSNDTLLRARVDPEVFITSSDAFVYYNRYNPTVNPGSPYCKTCSEGVFRARMGLGPPQ